MVSLKKVPSNSKLLFMEWMARRWSWLPMKMLKRSYLTWLARTLQLIKWIKKRESGMLLFHIQRLLCRWMLLIRLTSVLERRWWLLSNFMKESILVQVSKVWSPICVRILLVSVQLLRMKLLATSMNVLVVSILNMVARWKMPLALKTPMKLFALQVSLIHLRKLLSIWIKTS